MSDYQNNVSRIIEDLGGPDNIAAVSNCMTRLRVVVRDEGPVREDVLREQADVLGLVHDRENAYEVVVGPGKCRKYADICYEMGLPKDSGKTPYAGQGRDSSMAFSNNGTQAHSGGGAQTAFANNGTQAASSGGAQTAADGNGTQAASPDNSAHAGSAKKASGRRMTEAFVHTEETRVKAALKTLGDIFIPLIPGVIAAGLCAGFAAMIAQIVPDYADHKAWNLIYNLLSLINVAFMTYITAWVGYRAAERFGATPILGGMLGMITTLDGINTISSLLGLYDQDAPLASVLRTGKGGVLAVVFGVLLMAWVEKKIRSRMPESLDIIFTPLLTLLICVIPYVLVIMPLLGFVSSGIVWVFGQLCMSSSIIVRILVGFVSAAIFLPLVATGMHHGLVALYTVQLDTLGYVTLYPALAMAGAGQVGAALAIRKKAKKVGNTRLCSVIDGALPAGFLGIGEPLIYGVTLPLGRPFITAGIGAGFGGALVMAMEVASTTWGPSGLLGMFVMTEGPAGAIASVLIYLAGLVISYICSFIITYLTLDERDLYPQGAKEGRPINRILKETRENIKANLSLHHIAKIGEKERVLRREQEPAGVDQPDKTAQPDRTAQPGRPHQTVRHGESVFFETIENPFTYILTDTAGIHARPAADLIRLVRQYNCEVTIRANGKCADAKSMAELMSLGAAQGTALSVLAEGKDAPAALAAVKAFLEERL